MNLSNRLTFSLIFSVVLVAALAFIVAPAMAQQTVHAYGTRTDATATADGKWEVKFKFSEGGAFDKKEYFTTVSSATPPVTTYNISYDGTALTEAQFNAVTLSGNTLTFTIPKGSSNLAGSIAFTIDGYGELTLSDTTAETAALPLAVTTNYLASRAYTVYARAAGSSVSADASAAAPVLGTAAAIIPTAVPDPVTNDEFPADLENFFNVKGGTIDLILTGTSKNSKHIIINEIMWASDNRLIGQGGQFNQQWIEVYNRSVIPVDPTTISFRFIDDTFPAPALKDDGAVSDRLSNIAGRQNIWELKGSGTATSTINDATTAEIIGANPAFTSMYRSNQGGDGWVAGHWTASGRAYFPGFNGTPGGANTRAGLPAKRANPPAYTPPKDRVIINEVFNSATAGLDWLELRNVSDAEQNIKDWHLTYTHGTRMETSIQKFPEIKIPAGEVILIVAKGPSETDLAAGMDITETKAINQAFGAGPHKYRIIPNFAIPEITAGFLMLRSHGDAKFFTGRQHLHDAAGPSRVTYNTLEAATDIKEKETGNFWKTDAWPINGHTGNNYRAHNAGGSNNSNASLDPAANFKNGTVWARSGTAHGWRKGGGSHAGFNGGIGYDRGVKGNGTPGYHNDVVKGKTGDITDGGLIISELMLTTNGGRYSQWIELHNTSRTRGIDLSADGSDPKNGWQMIIENHNSGSWSANERPLVATINLKEFGDIKYIPPNQTVLIVSRAGRHSSGTGNFPSHRVASVWGTPHARDALKPKNGRDDMLNAAGGFYIKIVDGDGNVSDEIGNLDGKAASVHKGSGIDDPYSWLWPTEMTEDGQRTSLIRLMDGGTRGVQAASQGTAGTPRKGVPDRTVDADMTGMVLPLGTAHNRRGGGMVGSGMMDADGNPVKVPAKYAGAAWIHADDTSLADAQDTWYGSNDDIGTPLHTTGTPLPVSLSFFRPTLEDGKVVIRWTTESELDNAGFNILRSQDRNGEFTKVNDQLIQGKGTTAERSTYKWVDTSAKPGAVYYYQIEDVSFAGEHNTLTTTKLKGLISAKDKLTTKWGELKEVQ